MVVDAIGVRGISDIKQTLDRILDLASVSTVERRTQNLVTSDHYSVSTPIRCREPDLGAWTVRSVELKAVL